VLHPSTPAPANPPSTQRLSPTRKFLFSATRDPTPRLSASNKAQVRTNQTSPASISHSISILFFFLTATPSIPLFPIHFSNYCDPRHSSSLASYLSLWPSLPRVSDRDRYSLHPNTRNTTCLVSAYDDTHHFVIRCTSP